MKKLLFLALVAGLLTGCGQSQEKTDWLASNGGAHDKYTCENGTKMHTFWHGNQLRKAVVKNRWFTPVECDLDKKKRWFIK